MLFVIFVFIFLKLCFNGTLSDQKDQTNLIKVNQTLMNQQFL